MIADRIRLGAPGEAAADPARPAAPAPAVGPRPPRVSIGVPVYNGAAFLARTLEALLAQSWSDFEIIVSDNGSTDETEAIGRAFAALDSRVRYRRNPVNLGLAANYNGLVRSASGEFFKWATADDVCRPEFVRACVTALLESPAAVLAYPRTRFIDAAGRSLDIADPGFPLRMARPRDRLRYVMAAEHWVNAILGVIRRAALLRTRLLPAYPGGDYVLLGELCLQGPFVEIPAVLFERRLHPAASSQLPRHGRQLAIFFAGRDGRLVLPAWARARDHLRTVLRSGLSVRDKAALLGAWAADVGRRRARLAGEARIAAATLLGGRRR
ncbi:MAG TPA: glycosyltransferase family 2 protein [Methylomirabilota bacterium]|jgi:glycosyltransferase involved in cell wall biosynthesis|nr:glycosyltransferase family 2 protein [Methylomirabilota bacterium]